jgi:hypothetical protein
MFLRKLILFIFVVFFCFKYVAAAPAAATCLKELDVVLDHGEISRIVERRQLMKVVRLAQDEDMGCEDERLLTDEMLVLLKSREVVESPLWPLLDALRLELQKLSFLERIEVVAEWRSLWMEKVIAHVVYVNSLKRPWDVGFKQSLAYNSNVALLDPDSISDSADYKGEDWGLGLGGELSFKPTINIEKKLGWSYENQFNVYRQIQFDKQFLDVDLVSFAHKLTWFDPFKKVDRVSLGWDYLKAYSKDPTLSRGEYGRHAFRLKVRGNAVPVKKMFFDACIQRGSFQYRWKEEYPVPEDIYTWSVAYGVTLLAGGDGETPQSLAFDVSHDRDHASQNGLRDFEASSLMVIYGRSLADFVFGWPSSCMAALSVRKKEAASADLDELQFFSTLALMTSVTPYWSTSMSVTYLDKDRLDKDIQQWILAWNNDFATF